MTILNIQNLARLYLHEDIKVTTTGDKFVLLHPKIKADLVGSDIFSYTDINFEETLEVIEYILCHCKKEYGLD